MFDEKKGIVRNTHGRVDDDKKGGLYVSGWLKRGPSGIIGTNITDAKDTVASIIKDIEDETIRYQENNASMKGRAGLDKILDSKASFLRVSSGFGIACYQSRSAR